MNNFCKSEAVTCITTIKILYSISDDLSNTDILEYNYNCPGNKLQMSLDHWRPPSSMKQVKYKFIKPVKPTCRVQPLIATCRSQNVYNLILKAGNFGSFCIHTTAGSYDLGASYLHKNIIQIFHIVIYDHYRKCLLLFSQVDCYICTTIYKLLHFMWWFHFSTLISLIQKCIRKGALFSLKVN